MGGDPAGPGAVRSIAVTAEDVVAALEARRRAGRPTVLRLTPPFSGRMRARIHVAGDDEYPDDPAPVHLDPDDLVTEEAPAYPDPAETGDELRADPDLEYSRERHRERHVEAVERWRDAVAGAIADSVTIETAGGPREVQVAVLG